MDTYPNDPLENNPSAPGSVDLPAQYVGQAQAAAARGDLPAAILAQEAAVALLRRAGEEKPELSALSVLLFNLADFYGQMEEYDQAVTLLEEVVSLDEATASPDLETDRRTLQAARKLAALTPEERLRRKTKKTAPVLDETLEASIRAQLAELPPEQRPQAEAALRQAIREFQALTPEQQATLAEKETRTRLADAAAKMRDAALAYARRQAPAESVLEYIGSLHDQINAHEPPGSDWYQIGQLCAALIAAIKQEPIPPVPAAYQDYLAVALAELKGAYPTL
jgi:hypothetical protein